MHRTGGQVSLTPKGGKKPTQAKPGSIHLGIHPSGAPAQGQSRWRPGAPDVRFDAPHNVHYAELDQNAEGASR